MFSDKPSLKSNFKRLIFVNVNKYQQQVLLPCLILCLLSCVGVFYMMYYIHYVDKNLVILCNMDVSHMTRDIPWFMDLHRFNKVVPWIFFGLSTTLLIVMIWMIIISNKILGPSIRILNELDDILSGKRKDPIGTRQGDEMFEELLKRINTLIQKVK